MSGAKVTEIRVIEETDFDPDLSDLEKEAGGDAESEEVEEFAKKRLQAYERGDWEYIGIYIVAEVVVDHTVQLIRTPGVWGTESDSNKEYKYELVNEEYEELKGILSKLGIRKLPPISSARWIRKYEGR